MAVTTKYTIISFTICCAIVCWVRYKDPLKQYFISHIGNLSNLENEMRQLFGKLMSFSLIKSKIAG